MSNIKNYIIKRTLKNFLLGILLVVAGFSFVALITYGFVTYTIATAVSLGALLLILIGYVAYEEARDSAIERWLRGYENRKEDSQNNGWRV